jgi:CBS domain-containing protein
MNNFLSVKEAYRGHGTSSITLDENTPLKTLIGIFANQPNVQGIFMVDGDRRFLGIVSQFAIRKWAQFQLFDKWQDDGSCSEIGKIIESVNSKTVARADKTIGLKVEDALDVAFKRMLDLGENILPVVDDEGKVIGDLTFSEVLLKITDLGCVQGANE